MNSLLPLIIFLIFLTTVIIMVAYKYDKTKKRVEQHEAEGTITKTATPDSMSKYELRNYTVNYLKDGKQETTTLQAQNYLDAKYQAIVNLDVDPKSILSVV